MQLILCPAVFVLIIGSVHAECPSVWVCMTTKCSGIQLTVDDLDHKVSNVKTTTENTARTASKHGTDISEINTKLLTVAELIKKVADLNNENLKLEKEFSAIVKKEDPLKIGFSASRSTAFTPGRRHQVVIFDRVLTNIGNNYNPRNGKFTVPYNGMYIFQWTMLTKHGSKADTYLMVNGQIKGTNPADSSTFRKSGYRSGSSASVLSLKRNDKVWIVTISPGYYVVKGNWSSFQGWLQNKF